VTLVLAHAGEGASWQALLTVISAGLLIVFVLAGIGRLRLQGPGDLTVPIASVAVLGSLAPIGGDPVSDAAPWAVPGGVVLLASLIVAATTSRELTPRSPLAIGTVVLAIVASLALAPILVDAWYPDELTTGTTAEDVAES
jgi:hypothetical protein